MATDCPSSDIRQDLACFDDLFGLPAAKLQVVNALAHAQSPWLASIEEVAGTRTSTAGSAVSAASASTGF